METTLNIMRQRVAFTLPFNDIFFRHTLASNLPPTHTPLQVRDDELEELDEMIHENCEVQVRGGSENVHGKVNILLQTHISRGRINSFSLVSDQNYVVQVKRARGEITKTAINQLC